MNEKMSGKLLTLIAKQTTPGMHKPYILICTLLLFSVFSAGGQSFSENSFTRYSTTDGLSDNDVTGIVQDATGYIWLPTSYGLNRFDGTRFIKYGSTGDTLSPASDNFIGGKQIDKERLAFYTTGLHIINTKTGKRRNLFIPWNDKQYQYKFNVLPEVLGDETGDIYILNRSGFYHFDKNYRLVYRFDYYKEEQVPSAYFIFGRELLRLDKNRLLIVSVNGYYIYDKREKLLKELNPGDEPLLDGLKASNNDYFRLFQVAPGCLLFMKQGTDSIYYLDFNRKRRTISKSSILFTKDELAWRSKLMPANDSVFYLTSFLSGFYKLLVNHETGTVRLNPEKNFKNLLCYGLLTDRDNYLWVATNKGLYRQNDFRSKVETAYLPDEIEKKFPNTRVSSVFVSGSKVYAGSRTRAGLLVFGKKNFQFEKQVFFGYQGKMINANHVYGIEAIGPGELLLGTNGYLLSFNETTGKGSVINPENWNESWVNDIYRDHHNNIWISAFNLFRYHIPQRRFTIIPLAKPIPSLPSAIREDRYGNIWVAAHGISRYNTSMNAFDFKIDSFPFISFPNKQTSAMEIDRNNTIWFGCVNNGLVSYNIDNKTWRHFTRSNGLPDNNISSLLIIGKKLWITCYSGLACLDLESLQIKSFGKEEGFPDIPVMGGHNFYYDSLQRQLYVCFFNALVRFNPYEILIPAKPPSVFIENLHIAGGSHIFLPDNIISTSWKQNDLTITAGSINFNDGQSQGYAYRILKKDDSPWQPLGSQPSFSVSNLAPGKHRIQVKVFSLNNRWREQVKEITIEVLPPFWQKNWFQVLGTLLLTGLIALFIQWRTNTARRKEMENTQVQTLKADDYKNKYELEQISNYFSSSLANKKNADEVLWDVAENLIGRMNYMDCMIYQWNEDKTKMIQKAAYGLKGKPELLSEMIFDVKPGQGVVGYVMQTMEPVLIKNTRTDRRYRVDEARRLSEICVPIIHNNELLGIIDSEHPEINYYSERDLKILTTIATLIGNKLKQLESEQTLEVKEQEISSINEQLAEAKLAALQAQMNPHFVFNALNSIKRMILDGDNDKASRYLSKFALMIRMTLNHSKEAFVTLAENIEYLSTYLSMEQHRFDDSFNWNISVADDIDTEETHIPSLMIQPLAENAIWHGLLHSDREKKLSVFFTRHDGKITCIIEDNGIGIRKSEKMRAQNKNNHRSLGLDNLRNRIKILNEKYGTECSLLITDLSDLQQNESGTRVTLQFNIITL